MAKAACCIQAVNPLQPNARHTPRIHRYHSLPLRKTGRQEMTARVECCNELLRFVTESASSIVVVL